LDHPNIIEVIEVYETEEEWAIVLQLAPGGELFEALVKNGALGERRCRDITKNLLKAVSFFHKRNVVHRDLKPENILLKDEDSSEIFVADFGLATTVKPGEPLTKQCGSFEYAAPEVLKTTPEGYGVKVDMWSIGVIVYTILCGYQPFQDSSDSRQLRAILSGTFTFHKSHWTFISDDAKDFVKMLLEVDPIKRFSAQEALKHPWLN
jgi:calcium/calmodulin-dependent protein kinase I